jgi:hypothetical protein
MLKDKTENKISTLDKTDTSKANLFTTDNLSQKNNQKAHTTEHKNKKKDNKKDNKKKARRITIKKYCDNYKHNYLGKQNKALYDACKTNQYCRKNKCKDIDKKFDKIKNNKLGNNGNILLTTSITSKCPIEMPNKSRKKCLNKATKIFYEENNMGDIYKQVLECDNKICAKERQIYLTNLFRANKTKKRILQPIQVNLEDIPDQQMIESN